MSKLISALGGLFRPRLPAPAIIRSGQFVGRARTADVAFPYRMGAGVPGTVNRTHPATIEPALNDPTNPTTAFGMACLANPAANSVRSVLVSDGAITSIYGITVRPYPFQAAVGGNYGAQGFGGELAPPGAVDVLRAGYILVQLRNFAVANAGKGGAVFVWVAPSAGFHILGGFEAASAGASTIQLDAKSSFNGPSDASGVCELIFNA